MICPSDIITTCYLDDYATILELFAGGLVLGTLIGTLAGAFAKSIKAKKG